MSIKKIIFLVLVFVLIILFLAIFIIYSKSASKKTSSTRLPIPSIYLISPPPDNYSGGSGEGFKKYLEKHPQIQKEADLRIKTPIKKEKFTLEFSYKDDKFRVVLNPDFENARLEAENWLKEQGITDFSKFDFISDTSEVNSP